MISRKVFQSTRLAKVLLIPTLCFTLLLCGLNELTPHSLFSNFNVFSANELTVKKISGWKIRASAKLRGARSFSNLRVQKFKPCFIVGLIDQSRDISALLPVHQGLSKQGRLAWLGQPF